MRAKHLRFIGTVVVSVVLFAACGGDDTISSGDLSTSTTQGDGATGSDDGSSDDLAAFSGDCGQALQNFLAGQSGFAQAMEAAFGGPSDDSIDFDEVGDSLVALADQAPDEIADAFAVYVDELSVLFAAFAELDFTSGEAPTAEQLTEFAAASESIDEDRLDAASSEISAWFQTKCQN
jgi:hypothetical protein